MMLVEPLRLPQHDLDEPAPAVVGRQVLGERLDGARERGQRIADLVRDVGGEPPDGGQAVGLAHALLHPLDGGEILADADEPDRLALAGAQRPEGDADGHLVPVAPPQAELVAPRRAPGLRSAACRDLVEVDAGPKSASHGWPSASRPEARDGLGGAVEGGDAPVGVDGDEPGADRLEDQVAERLEVREVLRWSPGAAGRGSARRATPVTTATTRRPPR